MGRAPKDQAAARARMVALLREARLRAVERRRTLAVVRRECSSRADEARAQGNPDAARRLRDLSRDLVARLKALYAVGDEV